MKIKSEKVNFDVPCEVHYVHVVITDIKSSAQNIVTTILDTSWMANLTPINKKSFEARSHKTINYLVDSIFKKVEDLDISEFGEYLVSFAAQESLCLTFNHKRVPIAEIFKERLIGNMGFDFHTETPKKIILFGEAKYSSNDNPYTEALSQINDFLKESKDAGEIIDLQHLVSPEACQEFDSNKKAFAAAFSVNAEKPSTVQGNALKSAHLLSLLTHSEIYLIGVEISDK